MLGQSMNGLVLEGVAPSVFVEMTVERQGMCSVPPSIVNRS